MRQVLQHFKTGKIEIIDSPTPRVRPGSLLVETRTSVISAGTERMLLEFGEANLIEKARKQPDKVKMVMDKIKTDGLLPTVSAVRRKLDEPIPMGYSNCGVVVETGPGVTGFAVGDRVISNGSHAEFVCVPANLCAKVPDGVTDEAASFTVLGAIALQGVRLAGPTLGETFVVTGLGLIGLLTVQMLRAHGCRVIGLDFKKRNLEIARQFGAETVNLTTTPDPAPAALAFSRGRGVDGVIITTATDSDDPVHQGATMCRKRARIILVGTTGLKLSRADFYEKELTFQVSCSYGPGRYDRAYEDKGLDYPIGFVRWTEQRNFEAVLDMMADGHLDVSALISHRFPLTNAGDAYQTLKSDPDTLGILLSYANDKEAMAESLRQTVHLRPSEPRAAAAPNEPAVGFIGPGRYATNILIPALKRTGAALECVASSSGASGVYAGRKFGFKRTTTSSSELLDDAGINTVFVATRPDSHAHFVCEALRAGKHVFAEKPLAIDRAGLNDVQETYSPLLGSGSAAPQLMVGFNRRFAPHTIKIRELLDSVSEPKTFVMTINPLEIPADDWMQDPAVTGGRIIGEGCHFIDLLRFLAGHPITSVRAATMLSPRSPSSNDVVTFTLGFADGSIGTIHYLSNGHRLVPKERLEVFCAGRILQLDNFKKLRAFGWPGFKKMSLRQQDKGQAACVAAFVESLRSGEPSPIPFDELVEVTNISFQVAEAASR